MPAKTSRDPFLEGLRRGELRLPRCTSCGAFHYPLKAVCPACLSEDIAWAECSGLGRVYSYVVTYRPGKAHSTRRQAIAVVELEEGPRLLAPLVGVQPDPEHVRVAMPVRVAFPSEDGPEVLLAFRPVS